MVSEPTDPDDDGLSALEPEAECRQLPVPEAGHGQRLDKVLAQLVPEFSRSYLQQLIAQSALRINGQTVLRPAHKLRAGDVLDIELRPTPISQAFTPQALALNVVFEDAHVLVLNKAAGMVVHPAPGNWSGTVLNALLARDAQAARLPRAGIVHRLDKDTSGLMVVARTRVAMDALVRQISSYEVEREYLALAQRPWQGPAERTVDAAIGRDVRQRVRMAVVDWPRQPGKPAQTRVRCLDSTDQACLLRCTLVTGRTHQIRVHMSHIGHPLVGDALYGGAALDGLQRQGLHAARLALSHPVSGQWLEFCAPLPDDVLGALQALDLTIPH